jgi:NTE family protein
MRIHSPALAVSLESSFFGFYAHAGFCAGLEAASIRPAVYSGASSGAMVAALMGAGFSTDEVRELLFSKKFRLSFLEWRSVWMGIAMTFWLRGAHGLCNFKRARPLLQAHFAKKASRLENCSAPRAFIAVADLSEMKSRILDTGDIVEAVLASCSFPVLVGAQQFQGNYCWDGGLADSCPIAHYAEMPEITTIATHSIQHGADAPDPWKCPGARPRISELFGRGHQLITNELQAYQRAAVLAKGKTLTQMTTHTARPHMLASTRKLENCYSQGYETAGKLAASFA